MSINYKSLFDEMTFHLMNDESSSIYLNQLLKREDITAFPLNLLNKLKDTKQSKQHHPEGSVWNHTLLVVDEAGKVKDRSQDPKAFMWAALLHDIGKPGTTQNKKGKITSYHHDTFGAGLSRDFMIVLTEDAKLIQKVSTLVKWHMHMLYVLKNLPFGDPKQMIKEVDINEIALLCLCDRLGRTGADREEEFNNYNQFIKQLNLIK